MIQHNTGRLWMAAVVCSLWLAGCARPPVEAPATREGVVQAADGVPIHYDVTGEGEPALVFVHCWTCDRSFWSAQRAHFAPHYTVVRVDLAGHGQSGHGRAGYDMESFGADVAAVVEALNLSRVVIIGHSMGGPVSVEAAEGLGERVIGVVGVDTFYTGFPYPKDDEAIAAFVRPFEEDFAQASNDMARAMFAPGADPVLVEHVVTQIQGADQPMAISAMYAIFDWNRREVPAALDRLGPRLHNINGDPAGENRPLHESVVLIPGTGHFPHLEKPQAFNGALQHVLEHFQ